MESPHSKTPLEFLREIELGKCNFEDRFEVSLVSNDRPLSDTKQIIGYFNNELYARLFTKQPPYPIDGYPCFGTSHSWKTERVTVLVDSVGRAYLIDAHPIVPLDEQKVIQAVKETALGKLTQDEWDVLRAKDIDG